MDYPVRIIVNCYYRVLVFVTSTVIAIRCYTGWSNRLGSMLIQIVNYMSDSHAVTTIKRMVQVSIIWEENSVSIIIKLGHYAQLHVLQQRNCLFRTQRHPGWEHFDKWGSQEHIEWALLKALGRYQHLTEKTLSLSAAEGKNTSAQTLTCCCIGNGTRFRRRTATKNDYTQKNTINQQLEGFSPFPLS